MRVIVTGGGTGGHIYPALSIVDRIKTAIPDCEILYVGSEYGLEKKIVGENNSIKYVSINVRGFDRRNIFKFIFSFLLLFVSIIQSFFIIKKFKPNLVIGTGGYVCGPVLFVASLLKIDTFIHEQNIVPGVTVKILSKFATKVLVSFKETIEYFKNTNNIFYTGNPVRKEFFNVNRENARKQYNIDSNEKVIITIGGSGGSEIFNKIAFDIIDYVKCNDNIVYYHITGRKYYDNFKSILDTMNVDGKIRILDYCDDMPNLLATADLCISRAGAIALSEISALSIPSILIPSPYVAHNHQEKNANYFSKLGCCKILLEKDLNKDVLLKNIDDILKNDKLRMHMKQNFSDLNKENALDVIISMVYDYYIK